MNPQASVYLPVSVTPTISAFEMWPLCAQTNRLILKCGYTCRLLLTIMERRTLRALIAVPLSGWRQEGSWISRYKSLLFIRHLPN